MKESIILIEGGLVEGVTVSKIEIVQQGGNRQVKQSIDFYNLDAIITMGYYVSSNKATRFRQ